MGQRLRVEMQFLQALALLFYRQLGHFYGLVVVVEQSGAVRLETARGQFEADTLQNTGALTGGSQGLDVWPGRFDGAGLQGLEQCVRAAALAPCRNEEERF